MLRDPVGPALLVASFLAVAGVPWSRTCADRAGDIGATTEIAALATFLLGALAGAGRLVVAGATGVAVAVLLAEAPAWRLLARADRAGAGRGAGAGGHLGHRAAAGARPGYGPWQVLNPFEIWMVVVLVSAVSFAGFVAMRWKGEERGCSGRRAGRAGVQHRRDRGHGHAIARGAGAGAPRRRRRSWPAVMCVRVAVLVGGRWPRAAARLAPALGAMAVVGLVSRCCSPGRRDPDSAPGAGSANPFSLRSAMMFGAVFARRAAAGAWLPDPVRHARAP